jgi:predicted nucleic acid-binding protein
MSSFSETCLDASVVIRFFGTSAPTDTMKDLWRGWAEARVTLHAPALLRYEVVNALHRMRGAGQVSAKGAYQALVKALDTPIVLHNDNQLHVRAFELAADHGLPATYDAHYLALAERLDTEFWTADARLAKAVADRLAWVRLVS